VEALFTSLRGLRARGTALVYISHRLEELRAIAGRVTVLRDGRLVLTAPMADLTNDALIEAMSGRELAADLRTAPPAPGTEPRLRVRGLAQARRLHDVSLEVRAGEVLGLAGLMGSGRSRLLRTIFGADARTAGTVEVRADDDGWREVHEVADAIAAGLGLVPEDRQHGGLWLEASVADNLALGRSDITGRFRTDRGRMLAYAGAQIAELDIRPADPSAIARTLSGGNQQKIVIGRELSRPQLSAVLACQPTRGVDLGAIARIHDRLRAAATYGAGVLVISADLDELLALCHRVVVMLRGKIVGERRGEALRDASAREALGHLMTGAEAA